MPATIAAAPTSTLHSSQRFQPGVSARATGATTAFSPALICMLPSVADGGRQLG